jgi:hypothetical protein
LVATFPLVRQGSGSFDLSLSVPVHLQVYSMSLVRYVSILSPIAGCTRQRSSCVLATSSGTLDDSASAGLLDSSLGVLAVTCLVH